MYFMNMQVEALSLPRACYNFSLQLGERKNIF